MFSMPLAESEDPVFEEVALLEVPLWAAVGAAGAPPR